jgi:hypothetical protein
MDKLIIWITALFLVVGGAYFIFQKPAVVHDDNAIKPAQVNNFDECVAAGNPVAESYPRQCSTPDGKHFTENIGNEMEMADLIKIDNPRPNVKIASPLTITGQARGSWFFEAVFPVELQDANGNVIASGQAQAQNDWMIEDFVPFSVSLEFTAPATASGNLILKKDNPSGLPENDKSLIVPVKF